MPAPDICDVPIPSIQAGCAVANTAGNIAGSAADSWLSSLGDAFAHAASTVLDAVFGAITSTSTIDLSAAYVTRNASALAAVALVVVVGLFVIQLVSAALRREPAGLIRALTGAAVAVLGTAAAATVTQTLLVAVDGICDGLAALSGTTIEQAARHLLRTDLILQLSGTGGGAVLMVVFGLLFVVGAALTLGTLLVRKALLIVAVVIAPLAFAGCASRLTSGWVRRWAEVTLALILSKLAIVVVFIVAVGMLGDAEGIGALLAGMILLLLACLAPWACFKVLDFAGTQVAHEWHRSTNGVTLTALQRGAVSAQSMMRAATPIVGAAAGAATGLSAGSATRSAAALPTPKPPAREIGAAVGPAPASSSAESQNASTGRARS